eukprot:c22791_g1_i1 orf=57-1868(-)
MSLKYEFRHKQGWYNLIIAMASGSDVFMEGRQTLNAWLLASGAPCIWELKVELGATVRDVLEHPSLWGLSVDVGVSLPPVSTFYHDRLHAASIILTQPPSWAGLRELASLLVNKASQNTGCSVSSLEDANCLDENSSKRQQCKTATNYQNLALEDSLWMMLMDFPAWLQFASLLLFQTPNGSSEGNGNSHSSGSGPHKGQPNSEGLEHLRWLRHQEMAARYIAWHFSPQDQKLRDLVVSMLMEMVQSWLCMKDEKCHLREDNKEVPAVKRRKLMTTSRENTFPSCDEQKVVDGEISNIESTRNRVGRRDTFDDTDSFEGSTQAVQNWLMNFKDCCGLLDSYTEGGHHDITVTANKQQAKRRLSMGKAIGDCTLATEQDCRQPVATSSQCKSSSFFDTFPLAALSCSPLLHNDAVVHLVLHFVMVGRGFSSLKKDVGGVMQTSEVFTRDNGSFAYQEGRKGLACREPSHRTEDFRDICQAPFCLNFSVQASSSAAASGAARVFRFLETLDLLETSSFVNGCNGLRWLGGFKDKVARQLQMCIKSWSRQVDSTCLTVLDDLQRRASLWAVRTGLESKTLRAFNQVIQGLDILIASSVVEDTLVDP